MNEILRQLVEQLTGTWRGDRGAAGTGFAGWLRCRAGLRYVHRAGICLATSRMRIVVGLELPTRELGRSRYRT